MNDIESCKKEIAELEAKLKRLQNPPVSLTKVKYGDYKCGQTRLILSTCGLLDTIKRAVGGRVSLRWNRKEEKWELGSHDVNYSFRVGTYVDETPIEGF